MSDHYTCFVPCVCAPMFTRPLLEECPWTDRWGGSPLTPMLPAHLFIPSITGRGIGTETCGIGSVFSPDDLWTGLYTYKKCILKYDLLLNMWLMVDGVWHLFYLYWLVGKGMAYGGLPFPGTGCPVPGVANICLMPNIWATACTIVFFFF